MKEIEVMVQVLDSEEVALSKLGQFEFLGETEIIDTYYHDPLRPKHYPNDEPGIIVPPFRIRQKNGKTFVTWKNKNFDENGKWLHLDEFETTVGDTAAMKDIAREFGLVELVEVHNFRRSYRAGKFGISFERVKHLGLLLEAELTGDDDMDTAAARKEVYGFIKSLNLNVSDEVILGKPELVQQRLQK